METKLNRPSRFWHADNETESIDQVHKPSLENRLINQVDKPGLSTKSINQVLNQVDKPGFKNQVYRPGFMSLEKLRGNPLRVIRFLYSKIENFDEKITQKIQLSEVMQVLELTRDSARTGIKFLTKNSLIITVDYLNGLYGWTRYKIADTIFNEIWSIDQVHKPGVKPGLSNNSNNKIITINDPWDEVDFSSLEHLGFEKSTLLQLKNCSTPEIAQASINYFAFQHKHENGKYKLPALISTLKAGKAWQKHPDYKTTQELAIEQIRKDTEEGKRRAEQQAKELFEMKFNEWFSKLTILEKKQKTISDLQLEFKNGEWLEIKKAWS